jgi:hypothetical protein
MNKDRRQQRPQNFASVVFAIDPSVARLGEHDLGRHHESGLLGNRERIQAESSLSFRD